MLVNIVRFIEDCYCLLCSPIELKFGDSIQPQLQPVGRQAILDVHLQ